MAETEIMRTIFWCAVAAAGICFALLLEMAKEENEEWRRRSEGDDDEETEI